MKAIKNYLVGAGLAAPDGVRVDTPFVFVVGVTEPTESLEGRGVLVVVTRRCGMRVGLSSLLSSDKFDPCLLGGFEPPRLAGREFGFEPPGVKPVLRK